uniref:Farnesyl pyrophosphate synthase n=1 Tax=Globodera rostochiensis TaxID=31243 RepID=A0A914H414_GLORO
MANQTQFQQLVPFVLKENAVGDTLSFSRKFVSSSLTCFSSTGRTSIRHAEQIFSEIHRETLKIDHRANTLFLRVERLAQKLSQSQGTNNLKGVMDQVTLEEAAMRKAFKSFNIIDQHSLDRQTLPQSLLEQYQNCDAPPQLNQLNPYREDEKEALCYYTDPSYFFELWRNEVLKECDGGLIEKKRAGRSSTSPSRQRRRQQQDIPQHQQNPSFAHHVSSRSSDYSRFAPQFGHQNKSQQNRARHGFDPGHFSTSIAADVLHFPAEYQTPQSLLLSGLLHQPPPPGMSMVTANTENCVTEIIAKFVSRIKMRKCRGEFLGRWFGCCVPGRGRRRASSASSSQHSLLHNDHDEPSTHCLLLLSGSKVEFKPSNGSTETSELKTQQSPNQQPDDSAVEQQPQQQIQSMQQIPPSVCISSVPPPPPPPPPVNFSAKIRKPSSTGAQDNRSLLLIQIQEGVKLKRVRQQEELAEKRAVATSNDVAAILRKRMEHCLGDSDSSSNLSRNVPKFDWISINANFMNSAATMTQKLMSAAINPQRLLRSLLPSLREELAASLTNDLRGAEAKISREYIQQLFDYTMGEGKFARSGLALRTYLALDPSPSDVQFHNAVKVSLAIEMLQTFFLIEDDIMDGATRRRGKPCRHQLPGVGLKAINDGLLLDCGIDNVVRRTLPSHPKMYAILHDFSEAKQKTVIGQLLDTNTELDEFSWSRYSAIVESKTSHYSYFLPLIVGYHLADCTPTSPTKLRQIAYRIGDLFQAQDDFLDCFGDPEITGKSNLTDLAEGKCTWVTCALVDKLSKEAPEKLNLFRENFGKKSVQQLKLARQILLQEGIGQKFEHYQTELVEDIRSELAQLPAEPIRNILHQTLDDIVNRRK